MSWSVQQACIRGSSCPEVAVECGVRALLECEFWQKRGADLLSQLADGWPSPWQPDASAAVLCVTDRAGGFKPHPFPAADREFDSNSDRQIYPHSLYCMYYRQFHTVRARKQIHSTNTLTYWSLLLLDCVILNCVCPNIDKTQILHHFSEKFMCTNILWIIHTFIKNMAQVTFYNLTGEK